MSTALVALIALALLFDVVNGFHDSANSIATVVSTKVLSPRAGRGLGGLLQFRGLLDLQTKVASSIADGVHRDVISLPLLRRRSSGRSSGTSSRGSSPFPRRRRTPSLAAWSAAAIIKGGLRAVDTGFLIKICAFIVVSPLLAWCSP